MTANTTNGKNIGRVTQIIGSTFDVEFPEASLPAIYNALKIDQEVKGIQVKVTGEVQQHLGGSRVRCVALGSTDGMVRGMECVDTGAPVHGAGRQGDAGPRVQPARRADRRPRPGRRRGALADPSRRARRWPICRPRPKLFETGIKVIDLLTPFVRGGKAGLFGGAGLGKTVILTELIARIASAHGGLLGVRRRRRANPRRERPLAGNAGNQDRQDRPQRHRADLHGLRPDERAARRPSARRPVGPDDGRMVPRFDRRRHAACSSTTSSASRRPAAKCRPCLGRMPSAVGYQPTLATEMGELQERITSTNSRGHHLRAGRVRAGRRSDRPGPGHRLRPPRRVHLSGADDLGKGHLSGRRSAGFVQPHSRSAVRRRAALRRRPPRAADPAAVPRIAGHHRHSGRRRIERRGQAGRASRPPHRAVPVAAVPRGRSVHRQGRARSRRWTTRSAASRKSATASGTTCPKAPSCTSARSRKPRSRPRRWPRVDRPG